MTSCIISTSIGVSIAAQKSIALNNVLIHKGVFLDRIDWIFNTKPICNRVPPIEEQGKIVFFMPQASTEGKDYTAMLAQLNNTHNKYYSCILESIEKPIKGLRCTVTWNPKKIGFEYEPYLQNGITFKFIYKKNIEKVRVDTINPIYRLARNDHIPRIMIDIGHGEHDTGAVNETLGIQEKDINHSIGLKVASLLRKNGYNVRVTRKDDTFIPLNERTTYAHNSHSDLFVSIHANAALNTNASGIETYYFSPTLNNAQYLGLTDQEIAICQQLETHKSEHSKLLAHNIHHHIITAAQKYNPHVNDRRVKSACYQVLCGTEMPATLVEVGFVTHNREAQLLAHADYQETLANGICQGLTAYIQSLKERAATHAATHALAHAQA